MVRIVVTIVVGFALLLLESMYVGLFAVDTWVPHVASAVIVYLAIRKEIFEGCLCLIFLAWIADLLAATPPGARPTGDPRSDAQLVAAVPRLIARDPRVKDVVDANVGVQRVAKNGVE